MPPKRPLIPINLEKVALNGGECHSTIYQMTTYAFFVNLGILDLFHCSNWYSSLMVLVRNGFKALELVPI